MTQPEEAFARYAAELQHHVPVSELHLHRIVREGKAALPRISSALAITVHQVMGAALFKLMKFDDALYHYKAASKLRPGYPAYLTSVGAVFLALDRPRDALAPMLDALDKEENPALRAIILGNLSEAFHLLGDREGALEALEEAIAIAPSDNEQAIFALATQLAELGAHTDAVRYFWKFVALRRGLTADAPERRELHEDEELLLRQTPSRALNLALRREQAFGEVLRPLTPNVAANSLQLGGGRAIYDEFSRLRARATRDVLERQDGPTS